MCKITEKHLQCSEYEPHAAATVRTALTENLRVSMVILQPFRFSQHMTDLCVYNLSTALLSQCPAIHILELFTLKRYVWSCLPHTFLLPKPVGDPDEDDWQYTSDDKHDGTMCFCHLRRLRLQNSK